MPKSLGVITGRVVHGVKYGRKLGFPTANIDRRQWARRQMKMPHGIYAGTVELSNGRLYKAGIVIGPLDKVGLPKIEAHLIDFKGNLYDKHLTLHLHKYIRTFQPYKNEALLKQQIKRDIVTVKKLTLLI